MESKLHLRTVSSRWNKPINHGYWKTSVQQEQAGLSGCGMTDEQNFSPNSNLENRMYLCKSLTQLYLHWSSSSFPTRAPYCRYKSSFAYDWLWWLHVYICSALFITQPRHSSSCLAFFFFNHRGVIVGALLQSIYQRAGWTSLTTKMASLMYIFNL